MFSRMFSINLGGLKLKKNLALCKHFSLFLCISQEEKHYLKICSSVLKIVCPISYNNLSVLTFDTQNGFVTANCTAKYNANLKY